MSHGMKMCFETALKSILNLAPSIMDTPRQYAGLSPLAAPPIRLSRLHDAQLAGLEARLDAVRVGRTCGDVAQAVYRMIEKHGFKKTSRCGYPVGMFWLEQTASLKKGDATVLRPNMTFHLHVSNWDDEDLGYAISETIRVTEADALTNAPRKLFQL
ncbi:Xaa-Pro aminopeptidase [Bradyrhizobium elkanii]|nr:Xaa-Pro aminopeptidase [Bradyrhizobium elkanii]